MVSRNTTGWLLLPRADCKNLSPVLYSNARASTSCPLAARTQPISDNTTVTGNQAFIAGNNNPYRWIHGQRDTHYDTNKSFGRTAGFCEGRKLPRNTFLFVVDFELADTDDPPAGELPMVPLPKPLAPCQ